MAQLEKRNHQQHSTTTHSCIHTDPPIHTYPLTCTHTYVLHSHMDLEQTQSTHLVISSRIQSVIVKDKLHHCSMTFLGCPVEHCVTFMISAMQQSLHLGGQAPDGTGMATLCCKVQSVLSVLHKHSTHKHAWYRWTYTHQVTLQATVRTADTHFLKAYSQWLQTQCAEWGAPILPKGSHCDVARDKMQPWMCATCYCHSHELHHHQPHLSPVWITCHMHCHHTTHTS